MAKLSVSVPDELVDELRGLATGNVSAFVTTAIRHEVDRRQLFAFLDEMDNELGPVNEDEVASFIEVFTQPAPATGAGVERRGHKARKQAHAS
jgi:post-segregation antitoxin (ccd killing protein)